MSARTQDAFSLAALHAAVDERRGAKSLTWATLSREIGVAASTIRRFATASDAEADGVLIVVRWLETSPEFFVPSGSARAELLPKGGVVRVDMDALRRTKSGAHINAGQTRTTIQRLAQIAETEDRSIASLVRISRI